jgi:hypothetical protein
MPIDPYAPCPGGTGKKVKFCCPDLTTELDKIQRMLDGEQRAACLEYIDSLQAKFPDRACLLSVKAMLEAQLGHQEKAEATLSAFRQKHPENPVALAEEATLAAETQGATRAVSLLQDALEKCVEEISPQVYDALGVVAGALLAEGHVIAARAHVALQIAMSAGKDQQPLQLLSRINNSPSVPLLAKQDLPMLLPPDDALWSKGYTKAVDPARHGAWRLASNNLLELASKVGDWPTIWHNIAVLRTYLADTQAAVDAWRKYAFQNDVPLDDAVEAEALAQLLDAQAADRIDLVTLTYPAKDAETLIARVAGNPRMPQMPPELLRMSISNPDEPPPKAAYWILDRAVPPSGRDLKPADVPRIVGHALLFGKQTDRLARFELTAYRPELAQAQSVLGEVAGDTLDPPGPEEIDSSVSMMQQLLSANWRLPDDTPPEVRLELARAHRNEVLLKRWPELPLKILDGKAPREAVADPKLKIKVLAAILLLDLAINQGSQLDLNELRSQLGLSTLTPIPGKEVSAMSLPLARIARVEPSSSSDESLLDLFRRAEHYRDLAALRKLALEALNRPTLEKELPRAEVYGTLAQLEPDTTQSINYLQKAREAAEAAKTSTAPWDLAELTLRIARGEVAEADRLLSHIRNEHIREPGVAQALFQILAEAGIIGPDGRPTAPRDQAGSIVVPQAAGAEPGKIWTPESDQPAASGKKSALWTPGME